LWRDAGRSVDLWEEAFDDKEGSAAEDEGDCDGGEGFGKSQPCFVDDQTADDREEEREDDGGEELLAGRLAPFTERGEAFFEKGEDGEDGAGLDHDVEQVGSFSDEGWGEVLEDEEVSGGRDGEEFGEAFDETEEDGTEEGLVFHKKAPLLRAGL
jgi:hypothetical protein